MVLFKKKDKNLILQEKKKIYIHNEMLKKATLEMDEEKVAPSGYMVSLRNINKIYPNHVQAVYDFNLDIKEKEFVVFVGPSGCGKSTTLRMIAGLESITYGDLFISGVYANMLPPKNRDIAMVFQNYALYPNLTVFENMAFGLRARHEDKAIIEEKVLNAAKILELTEYLNRKPGALSGGQRQRVALGRAIVRDAKVFLMDEPLSNLDAKLRVAMRSEIVNIHQNIGATTVYVTHDQTEAMTMADRIVVMDKGYIQQIGTPMEIYRHPANLFVATFIGAPAMNILDVEYNKGTIQFGNGFKYKLNKEQLTKVNGFYNEQIELLKSRIAKAESDIEKIKEDIRNKNSAKEHKVPSLIEKNDTIKALLLEIEEQKKNITTYEEILKDGMCDMKFGVRPEDVVTLDASSLIDNKSASFSLVVNFAELLGNEYYIYSNIGDNKVVAEVDANKMIEKSSNIEVVYNLDHIHLFDPLSTKIIF